MTNQTVSLQSVKATRPIFQHSHSHRSSSASHEYSTEYDPEVSSSSPGYETPPSRVSSPIHSRDHDTDMTTSERPPLHVQTTGRRDAQQRSQMQVISRSLNNISPPTPGVDDTPFIRFAIEQLSFDEDLNGRGRYSTHTTGPTQPAERKVSTHQQVTIPAPAPVVAKRLSEQPVRPPQPFRFPSSSLDRPRTNDPDYLLPVDAPEGLLYTKLGYVPIILRLPMLALLVILCIFMIAGIIVSNVYALRTHGLYDYDGDTTTRYFIFQYLPQGIGMIMILWLFVLQAAIYRSLPYFNMSAGLPQDRILQTMPIVPANFVFPDLRHFKIGEPIVGTVLCIFWLMNWTIPFLACFYQTQYYVDIDPPRWRWSTVQGLGWVMLAMYLSLIAALCYCAWRFRSPRSSLMWDAASLADLIVLFQRSNVLVDFGQSEVSANLETQIPPRFLRLGYWTPSNSPEKYYTVGQQNGTLSRLSFEESRTKIQQEKPQPHSSASFDIEQHRCSHDSAFTRDIHSPFIRYRWVPWFLRDGMVLTWAIMAFVLLLAFLVPSFVKSAVQRGFKPRTPSGTGSDGFSPSNFLYSFLPSLFGMFLFLIWQPIDVFYKSIQPFANLTIPSGATAKRSLLQSYVASLPGMTTVSALINRDFKLAYITFVSLMSITIPVLAGGVFTAQFFGNNDVRIVASMPGYLALSVFLTIYALSYIIIWPTRKRYLPHSINTIAGQLSFLYASPLLSDPQIRQTRDRADLVAKLGGYVLPISSNSAVMDEKIGLTGDGRRRRGLRERYNGRGNKWIDRQLKYAFGIYIGRDRKEHLGIDRLQRPDSGEMLVVTGMRRSFGTHKYEPPKSHGMKRA